MKHTITLLLFTAATLYSGLLCSDEPPPHATCGGLLFFLDDVAESELNRTPLHKAAAEGNIPEIHRLIATGISINQHSHDGATALHYAILAENELAAQTLLTAGANPNSADPFTHTTPLHYAAQKGLTSIVQILLDAGANPHILRPGPTSPQIAEDIARACDYSQTVAAFEQHRRYSEARKAWISVVARAMHTS